MLTSETNLATVIKPFEIEEVLPDCWLTDAFSHVELRCKEGGTEKNLSLRRKISTPVDFL